MLPQTNLQLYRLMIDEGADDAALSLVRASYDLARRLFVGCFRPSHKPFLCHLIGTAGALAAWGEKPETVSAGLLHSAYLYGDFGDGLHGVSDAKRRVVRARVGDEAEALVEGYTRAAWNLPLDRLAEAVAAGIIDREVVVIKFADMCDECLDAGPRFAQAKPLEFGLPGDREARREIVQLAESLVNTGAKTHFVQAFAELDAVSPPAALQTKDRSFHVVKPGLDELRRSPIMRRLHRSARRIGKKRAT